MARYKQGNVRVDKNGKVTVLPDRRVTKDGTLSLSEEEYQKRLAKGQIDPSKFEYGEPSQQEEGSIMDLVQKGEINTGDFVSVSDIDTKKGRVVTLANGVVLTGEAAENYGSSRATGTYKSDDGTSITYKNGRPISYSGAVSNSELNAILNNPNLSDDQKAAIQSIYDAVSSNDKDTAERIKAAMEAAGKYSDPYFKAQIRLAVDALDRGINSEAGDLQYAEKQLENTLKKIREDAAASKDILSFENMQELQGLARKLETDLGTTRDNLAASGFSSSSRRARSEQILNEENQGLVESSNRQLAYQVGNIDRNVASNEASTAAQLENIRRLAAEGKLDLFRKTEEAVGSDNLPRISGMDPLGDIGGSIPRAQVQDKLQFASNFVF